MFYEEPTSAVLGSDDFLWPQPVMDLSNQTGETPVSAAGRLAGMLLLQKKEAKAAGDTTRASEIEATLKVIRTALRKHTTAKRAEMKAALMKKPGITSAIADAMVSDILANRYTTNVSAANYKKAKAQGLDLKNVRILKTPGEPGGDTDTDTSKSKNTLLLAGVGVLTLYMLNKG